MIAYVLISVALGATCDNLIPDYTAVYAVERNGKPLGTATFHLRYNQGSFAFESETVGERGMAKFLGARVAERTDGDVHDCQYRPIRYTYHQEVAIKDTERDYDINWASGEANGQNKGDAWRLNVEPGTQSPMSLMLWLMQQQPDQHMNQPIRVLKRGRVRDYQFVAQGMESVSLGEAGSRSTLKIQQQRAKSDRVTQYWLDPQQHYLPVQVYQNESDDDMRMLLKSVEFATAPPQIEKSGDTMGKSVQTFPLDDS